ncbi:esterase [Sinomonas cyclohexanicum]|uniref:Esterase n=1 Tax=Sinomonas cyclohexanicum TaxID=322009 RepID=A0ABM7Q136_SINCY|nr:alpha/beta hydrolase family protein [Corynebacterium cyclohexanicum]BCT78210.1 esterase [Corynebacterium cyclohexanicum]
MGQDQPQNQDTYVLVHGAWHGAWCWRPVERLLVAAGARVFTPTLTGLGDRAHLLAPTVGLATHIADVRAVIETEGLRDVILVGHSYAGMVVTGVAAEIPDRIQRLVIVDGFLPEAGEAAIRLLPEHAAAHYLESAQANDGLVIDPRPVGNLGVTDQQVIDELTPRLTPQPAKTYMDAIGRGLADLPFTGDYLLCSGWRTPFAPFARRAAEAGWSVVELDADHEVLVTDPELLAQHLLQRGPVASVLGEARR